MANRAALSVAIAVVAAAAGCGGRGRAPSPHDLELARGGDCAAYRNRRVETLLDARTDSRARIGNSVQLLVNGRASLLRRLANAHAADLLLVKTFIISDDEIGRRLAALMAARARAGATVIFQYDVKGSMSGAGLGELLAGGPDSPLGERDIVRGLRDAGVIVVPANPPTRALELKEWRDNFLRFFHDPDAALERSADSLAILNHSDHEKYWITGHLTPEGRVELQAVVGGMNLASEYFYGGTRRVDRLSKRGGWRDTDVEVRGPVVTDMVERFFDVMAYHTGQPVDPALRARWTVPQAVVGSARVRFVWNQPSMALRRAIERLYVTLIDATPKDGVIRIENAYFAPSRMVRHALKRALERGTRLAVLTNSPETNDIGVVSDAARFAYYALLSTNLIVALFERRPRPDLGESTLHSKVASFGTCGPVVIGSFNLDAQSALHNSEDVVVIEDDGLRAEFDAMYELDVRADRASRVTLDLYRQQSVLAWLKTTWAIILADYWL